MTTEATHSTGECAVCGAEKPSRMLDRTTVETIAPLEADICAACQLVQDHTHPDDVCMQCGDAADTGFYIELEFPLGPAELPGRLGGTLCGDCASWIACDINYDGVHADEEAHGQLMDVLDEERAATVEGDA